MHAFLVTGSSQSERIDKSHSILEQLGLTEIIKITPDNSKLLRPKIKNLISLLQISPLNRKIGRGVIIIEANLLNQEAANTFLKTLEEPPPGNYFVLTAPTLESVIETISSRCLQIDLGANNLNLSKKEIHKNLKLFNTIIKGTIGQKFQIIDKFNDREDALAFINGQINLVREKMIAEPSMLYVELLNKLEKTYKYLRANVNTKTALVDLMLAYPHI